MQDRKGYCLAEAEEPSDGPWSRQEDTRAGSDPGLQPKMRPLYFKAATSVSDGVSIMFKSMCSQHYSKIIDDLQRVRGSQLIALKTE